MRATVKREISILLVFILSFTLLAVPTVVSAATTSAVVLGTYDLETPHPELTRNTGVSYTAFDNGSNGYLYATNLTSGPQPCSHKINMVAGREYTVTFDFYIFKRTTGTHGCLFALHTYNESGLFAEDYPNGDNYDLYRWHQMTWKFTANTTVQNDFNLWVYEGVEVVVDNLKIVDDLGDTVLNRTYDSAADDPKRECFTLVDTTQIHNLYPLTVNGGLYLDATAGTAVTCNLPDAVIHYTHTNGADYRISFDYRLVKRNTSGTEFSVLNNGSAVAEWRATDVGDTLTHSAQVSFTATAGTFALRATAGVAVLFDNFKVEELITDKTRAELSATVRNVGNEQYVDVTFNTGASARNFNYGVSYDPTVLQYVSTSGVSGVTAKGSATVTPALEKMVVDATDGDTALDFDFSNDFVYTNTLGRSLATCPEPTYFSIKMRYTGVSQDVNQALLQTFVNGATYGPSHSYVFCKDQPADQWIVINISTHSNPPAPDGQNTLTVSFYHGIKAEIEYVRVYSGWNTSATLKNNFEYAGSREEQPAKGKVNVSASAYASRNGDIATTTFRVIGEAPSADFGLSVTSPSSITSTGGASVPINYLLGKLVARTDNGNVRFGFSMPSDAGGEYFVTDSGKSVRPDEKGFAVALGYHAPKNMAATEIDPYVQRIPVTTPESAVPGGLRYTLAVENPPEHIFIAARFYVCYTENGQRKYVYSNFLSVTQNQLSDLSKNEWYAGLRPNGTVAISVDNTAPVQQNWQGANAVAQGYIYNNGYSQKQIDTEISRMKDMGINMVRSYFDQTYNATYNSYTNTISYITTRPRMTALKQWLQTMKDNNIEVALNMGWGMNDICELGYTCYDGWSSKNTGAVANAFYSYCQKNGRAKTVELYGKWVNDSLDYLINDCGFTNITHIIMFTEPGISTVGGKAYDYWQEYAAYVRSADAALKAGGNRDLVKMVGPNIGMNGTPHEDSFQNDLAFFDSIADYIDVYSFHFYAPHWPQGISEISSTGPQTDNYANYSAAFKTCVDFAKSHGKEYWFDEFNYSPGGAGIAAAQEDPLMGTQYAQAIAAAMNTGTQNALLWQLFEIKWPTRSDTGHEFENGIHAIGLAPSLTESYVPYAPYYAYGLLTKYLGDRGSTVYGGSGSGGVYSTMVKNADGSQTVMVVNTNPSAKSVMVNLQESLGGVALYRIAYDPEKIKPDATAQMIMTDQIQPDVTTSFSDVLPANGFAIYTTLGYTAYSEAEAAEYSMGGNLTAKMKTDSVLLEGNHARLSEKLAKLENGETVTVAYIGGSITEGYFAQPQLSNRYSAKLTAWLRQRYPKATVVELNAGIGATTSYLGTHRADAVLAQNPDIVILDFAVNDDAGNEVYQASYESLIYKAWNSASRPAVIGVAMAFNNNGTITNSQDDELQIARKYEIPMLSYRDMIAPLIADKTVEWTDLQADQVHPNSVGHDLIAKMIAAYISKIPTVVPESEPDVTAVIDRNTPYAGGTMLTPQNSAPSNRKFTTDTENWIHGFQGFWTASTSGAQLIFSDVSAQYIGIAYEEVGPEASASLLEVYVDNVLVTTVDPNGACGHIMGKEVFCGASSGTHTVKIKTNSADECKIIGLLIS